MELRSIGNPLNELVLAQSEQVLLRDFFMEEIWKPVYGYEGLYEVSNLARVRNMSGYIMKQYISKWDYIVVGLSRNGKTRQNSIHVLVAEAFIEPRNGKDVNHKDRNRQNNSIENLEVVSKRENCNHAIEKTNGLPIGVWKDKKKYRVEMSIKGKRVQIGNFYTVEDARRAYLEKARELGESKYVK